MTGKSLKAFSIASFCIPLGSVAFFCFAAAVNVKFLITAAILVYLFGWIPGLWMGITELINGRKNKESGEERGIPVLSVAGIVLNAIIFITILILLYALSVEASGQAAREALSSALMKG